MALSLNQIQLTQEIRSKLREELKEYASAPADITEPLDELWQSFKQAAEFDDDNQADLAAFGALSQFSLLAAELPEDQLRSMLNLFSISVLTKIKKGDRLD